MSACSFNRLSQFVDKQLDLDGQLKVYGHLDRCDICRDAVYQLSHDRDGAFFIFRANRVEPSVVSHAIMRQEDLWVREMVTNVLASTVVRFKPKSVVLNDVPETTAAFGPGSRRTMWRI